MMWGMGELQQVALAVIVAVLALMVIAANHAELWWGSLPRRFTIRSLLIVGTVLAIFLGACVAFAPR
jgi:membrane-bound acyltransferase YfiQ involved in biofilm formation